MNSIAVKNIKQGKVVLYPTDTIWGLGCDATNEKAIDKIFKIKQRSESKSLIILVDSIDMLKNYVESVPEAVLDILKHATRPTTIVYPYPKGLAKNVIANDNTVAIRIVKHNFCEGLIKEIGKPIVSTSANISGKPTPKSFAEISQAILDSVDYVVALQQDSNSEKSSRILKINKDGSIEVIRD
ncbi:L-threonylcarbamoyladenylate synthase [Flavicella sp.]|uniref:L-threonylcarbamoyladenylate synthase n=1 Tax=Flavicella sp. TaxID=2957742 RepID=UPI00301968C0